MKDSAAVRTLAALLGAALLAALTDATAAEFTLIYLSIYLVIKEESAK